MNRLHNYLGLQVIDQMRMTVFLLYVLRPTVISVDPWNEFVLIFMTMC
jgi:hypothetical protein